MKLIISAFDISGSMYGEKENIQKLSLKQNKIAAEEKAQYSVFTFDTNGHFVFDNQNQDPQLNNPDNLTKINCSGGTLYDDILKQIFEYIKLHNNKEIIIYFVTDGDSQAGLSSSAGRSGANSCVSGTGTGTRFWRGRRGNDQNPIAAAAATAAAAAVVIPNPDISTSANDKSTISEMEKVQDGSDSVVPVVPILVQELVGSALEMDLIKRIFELGATFKFYTCKPNISATHIISVLAQIEKLWCFIPSNSFAEMEAKMNDTKFNNIKETLNNANKIFSEIITILGKGFMDMLTNNKEFDIDILQSIESKITVENLGEFYERVNEIYKISKTIDVKNLQKSILSVATIISDFFQKL